MRVFTLFLVCQRCITENREIAKYCKNCGTKLSQQVISEDELKNFLNSNLYEERNLAEQEIEFIKQRINQWANSIPHHNLTNLADKIIITKINEIPHYEVIVTTLYEQREFSRKAVPCYEYESNGIKKTVSLEDIDLWNNLIVNTKKEFKESYNEYPIKGTEEIIKCLQCNGIGEVRCDKCEGRGILTCSHCRGKGIIKCSSCDGTGKKKCSSWGCEYGRIKCSKCHGRGLVEKSQYSSDGRYNTISVPCEYCRGVGYEPCDRCKGTGYTLCYTCDGTGMVKDTYCDGKGFIECSKCYGRGIVSCLICYSTGKLLLYYLIKQWFRITLQNIPSSELVQDKVVLKDKYIRFGEKFTKVFKDQKISIFELNCDSLSFLEKVLENSIQHKIIKDKIISTLKNIKTTDAELGKLIAVKVQINKLPVYKMEYNFQNKNYVLYLFGSSILNSSISSETDPIKEFLYTLINNFKTEIKNSNFTSAWDLFSKIEDIIKNQEELFLLVKMLIDTYTKTKFEQLKEYTYETLAQLFVSEVKQYFEKIKTKDLSIKIAEYIFKTYCNPYVDLEFKNKKLSRLIEFISILYEELKEKLDEQNFKAVINTEVLRKTYEELILALINDNDLLYAIKLVKLLNPQLEQKIKTKELIENMDKRWDFTITFTTLVLSSFFILYLLNPLALIFPVYILLFSFPFLSLSILYSKKVKSYLWTLLGVSIFTYIFGISLKYGHEQNLFAFIQFMSINYIKIFVLVISILFFALMCTITYIRHKKLTQELKV